MTPSLREKERKKEGQRKKEPEKWSQEKRRWKERRKRWRENLDGDVAAAARWRHGSARLREDRRVP